jgi:mRNA interferase MazF
MTRTFSIGDVVLAKFPEQDPQGREQQGLRPAVVVALPEQIGTPRFPLIVVVPLTTDRGQSWANASPDLYPKLEAGDGGLISASIVLLDQVRALDVNRVLRFWGTLKNEQYRPIQLGLAKLFSSSKT